MDTTIVDKLRPWISKVLAPIIAGFCTWLAAKYGIIIDENTQIAIVFGFAGLIAGTASLLINKVFNPGNMASTQLAVQAKEVNKEIKIEQEADKKIEKAGLNSNRAD